MKQTCRSLVSERCVSKLDVVFEMALVGTFKGYIAVVQRLAQEFTFPIIKSVYHHIMKLFWDVLTSDIG